MEIMSFDMREAAKAEARAHMQRAEDAVRKLLGAWVSELPGSVAYDQDYRVIGLSYGGKVVLPVHEHEKDAAG